MKKRYLSGLLIILSIFLAIVFSMVIYNEWPLQTGKRMVLAAYPDWPTGSLIGDYMEIRYDIRVQHQKAGLAYAVGDTIYIMLEEDFSGVWRQVGASASEPESGDFIKGEVRYINEDSLTVEYGIERYFVEGNAKFPAAVLEDLGRNMTAEVKVTSSGRAKLVQLFYNGKPLDIDYQNFGLMS